MTSILALAVVFLTGLYFLGLAAVSLFVPTRAARFLLGFASSAVTHYLELLIRLVVGGAFLLHAPRMLFSGVFVLFGWVLVITTVGLIAVPWQWHRRLAQRFVPYAIRSLRLVAIASFLFGGLILVAAIRGAARPFVSGFLLSREHVPKTPTSSALQRPLKSKEESNSSLQLTRRRLAADRQRCWDPGVSVLHRGQPPHAFICSHRAGENDNTDSGRRRRRSA